MFGPDNAEHIKRKREVGGGRGGEDWKNMATCSEGDDNMTGAILHATRHLLLLFSLIGTVLNDKTLIRL